MIRFLRLVRWHFSVSDVLILCALLLSACVTWDSFIAHERAACISECHAKERGWRIECYGRRCSCICPPREESP